MAMDENLLEQDIKSFEMEDGTVSEEVNADTLQPYLHQNQGDSFEGKPSSYVKKFFDYPVLHVFFPWLRALTKGFNALKNTVETKYLKREKVQEKYDPESADPMSGKAVAEAIDTVYPERLRGALAAIGGYLEVDELYGMPTAVLIAQAAGGETRKDVRCFVFHKTEEKLYFASAEDVVRCVLKEEQLTPILDFSMVGGGVTLEELFPVVESKEKLTSQTGYYQIPSDSAKLEVLCDRKGDLYFYTYNPTTYEEPTWRFKEGASSPYLLPDDIADPEGLLKNYWNSENMINIWDAEVFWLKKEEQNDKTAVSPTRLEEILESKKPKIIEDVIAALPNAEEVSV